MDKTSYDRERMTQTYLSAFDEGDLDAMLAVLEAAETDPDLTNILTNLHEEPEMKSLLPFIPKRKRKNDGKTRYAGWRGAVASLLLLLVGAGMLFVSSPELQTALLGDAAGRGLVNCRTTRIPTEECLTLVALYSQTDGDNWYRNTNWLTGDPCDWYQVGCNDGHVTRLELSNVGLRGTLPDLSTLSELQVLNLSGFHASGTDTHSTTLPQLPTSLRTLIARDSNFSLGFGQIYTLETLEYLDLSHNNFSDNYITSLARSSQIEVLLLNNNQFTGRLPNFSLMPSLRQVNVANNQFFGTIPEIVNLDALVAFDVSYNNLSGSIPHYDPNQVVHANFTGNHLDWSTTQAETPSLTVTRVDVQTMLDVVNTYMALMAGGRYQTAYTLYSPTAANDRVSMLMLRSELATQSERYLDFIGIKDMGLIPLPSLELYAGGERSQIGGTLTYEDGSEREYLALLFRADAQDSWRLIDFYVR